MWSKTLKYKGKTNECPKSIGFENFLLGKKKKLSFLTFFFFIFPIKVVSKFFKNDLLTIKS